MEILRLEPDDRAAALSFVLPYERFCIPLVARLREGAVPAFAAADDTGNIRAVLTFSKAGQLFHCIPLRAGSPKDALSAAFTAWFAAQEHEEHAFFSFNGESHGTALLLASLRAAAGRTPARAQRYDFMRSPLSPPDFPPPAGDCKIMRCTPSMADALFPLQTAYEKEEVVFNLATYSEDVSLLALRKALREQAVYALSAGGVLAAKGGTNAQGERYVQLGGVYTEPAFRGRGYARALIRRIAADFAAQGKRCALFVKPDNAAAQRLYAACGFEKYGVYETAYF